VHNAYTFTLKGESLRKTPHHLSVLKIARFTRQKAVLTV
jgi:hypothetical protein